MSKDERRRSVMEQAWVGDAVLALFARCRILDRDGCQDATKFARMTCNRFLGVIGDASEVEAEIGRLFQAQGLDAAFAWIEQRMMPLFERQEENRRQLLHRR